jgi:hypothetical protein
MSKLYADENVAEYRVPSLKHELSEGYAVTCVFYLKCALSKISLRCKLFKVCTVKFVRCFCSAIVVSLLIESL